jgi:hypothetical protein
MAATECPLCGSLVRVVGDTTKHYEPVASRADLAHMAAIERAASAMAAELRTLATLCEPETTADTERILAEYEALTGGDGS